ncbi:MAG: DHA2 family efflux MFS transporter permease subunit [Actinomycetales bacterium]|nr:DHA2 family efflux MFS transporter permease subunit [Candidatus Lutibacillus vidarii]
MPARHELHDVPTPRSTIDGSGWLALVTLGLGVGTVIMDATIVNVALPKVIEELALTSADAQWLNAAYSLVFAALLLLVGRVGDLYGRRRIFAVGMTVFMLASVVAGLAGSAPVLIIARLVQGIGAAMVVPSTLSALNATFVGRARTIAFAVWGASIGGMAAVGPWLGGWLATYVSWRWAFWLNIPVGLVVLFGIARALPESRDPSARRGFDWTGVALSSVGMAALVFAFIEGSYFGWWRQSSGALSPVPISLGLGLVALAIFLLVTRRRASQDQPVLVDLGLFSARSFRYGIIAALIVAFGEFGLLFTLPLLLQGALGYTPLGTGTIILVLALGTFLISGALPQITPRIGQRAVVRIGLLLEAVAVGGLALTLSRTIPGLLVAAWLFVYGLGVGMATAQLTSVILSDVPVRESGQASGLQSSVRQLGSALGVAVLGGLLIGVLGSTARANLAFLPGGAGDQIAEAVQGSAGIAIAGLAGQPDVFGAAADAMVHASKVTTGAAAVVIFIGLLATLALPHVPHGRHEAHEGAGA